MRSAVSAGRARGGRTRGDDGRRLKPDEPPADAPDVRARCFQRRLRAALPLVALLGTLTCAGTGPTDASDAPPAAPRDSVVALTNAARAAAGVTAVAADDRLHAVAQAHARDMAERGYFSHTTPDGVTFTQRLAQAGIAYRTAGENIAGNHSAAGAVDAWLRSDGHRRNMLNGGYGRLGVGVYRTPSNPYTYYVQVFTN